MFCSFLWGFFSSRLLLAYLGSKRLFHADDWCDEMLCHDRADDTQQKPGEHPRLTTGLHRELQVKDELLSHGRADDTQQKPGKHPRFAAGLNRELQVKENGR